MLVKTDYISKLSELNQQGILKARKEFEKKTQAKGNKLIVDSYTRLTEQLNTQCDFSDDVIELYKNVPLGESFEISDALKGLMPWRTGPFQVGDVFVDSEWQSFKKWDRISDKFPNLEGKNVADIGASAGYHLFRLSELNPSFLIGFDPQVRCYYQFYSLLKFSHKKDIYFEGFGWENLKFYPRFFDFVLCMGVLYHHRDPVQVLRNINQSLKKGGEVIIECQGIEGEEEFALFPEYSYGKSKGSYFLPMKKCLVNWLKRACFIDIKVITSHLLDNQEQRKTPWIQSQSYDDFFDFENKKTVEGYPLPLRIYVKARKKN